MDFDAFLEVAPVPVWIQRETEILAANEETVDFFGASTADELVGESVLTVVPEVEHDRVRRRNRQVLNEGESLDAMSGEIIDWNGTVKHGRFAASPIQYADGNAILVIAQDVTERREREQTLRAKNEKLELLNRLLRHDVSNDMEVVLGHAEWLADHLDDEDALDHLDTVIQNSRHVSELLDTVRALMGTMLDEETDLTAVELGPILDDELDHARSLGVDATVEGPSTTPDVSVRADEMLGAVFRNLLTNAIRHTDTPTVSVSVSVSEADVIVRIADDGPGIPDYQKDDIFGRGAKGLDSPGTGVGLYLVDTLVETYGGEVWVEDNDPEGAVFVVRLERTD